ncbi:MAG: glycosyltransferase family 2 protein [bacterium]|nr:glycosyltransferase family 2 protein [bacterium]
MNAISIIMPCYNRGYDLRRVLEAYDQQDTGISFELIAVDDASTDHTYELLTSYRPKHYSLIVERQAANQGPAAARNRGIAIAQAPLTLFVGDDILPAPDFVRQHIESHNLHTDLTTAILGYTTWPPDLTMNTLMAHIDGVGAQQFSYYYLRDGQEYDFRHFYTSNISIKTNFLKSLDHWFDTDFTYAAFEDAELAYRLSKKGLRILYVSTPIAYHYHYHNIWTFSKRQYVAGLMACLLVKKHPQLSLLIKGRRWQMHAWLWLFQMIFLRPKVSSFEHLEAKILSLASSYEMQSQANTDYLYLQLLNYFFTKGLIHGTFSKNIAKRVNAIYAQQVLGLLVLAKG